MILRARVPALVLGLLLLGCGADEATGDCSADVSPASPAVAGPAPLAGAGDAPPAVAGPPEAPFAVSLDAADKVSRTWVLEAAYGVVDEPLVLRAEGGATAGPPALPIPVVVTPARLGPDVVPLTLEGTRGGTVMLVQGASIVLHLGGAGFAREGTYRASLIVGGSERRVYALRIKSVTRYPPPGLRALKLVSTWDDVDPLRRTRAHTAVVAADAAVADVRPYHVVVRPAEHPSAGAQPLPSCGITAQGSGRAGAIAVRLPPQEAGRYEGVLDIEGQLLDVDVTIKDPWYVVLALVALGAFASIGVRALVEYFRSSDRNERRIAKKEREIGALPIAWDHLRVQNVLRHARGSNRWLGVEDVADLLEGIAPSERPDLGAVDEALDGPSLPAAIKDDLRTELERVVRRSSSDAAATIDRRLGQLQAIVQKNDAALVAAWVADLSQFVDDEARRLDRGLKELEERDGPGAKRMRAALEVFRQLVADAAETVADEPDWLRRTPEHMAQLRRIRRTLLAFSDWVTRQNGPDKALVVDILHCTDELPSATKLDDLRVRKREDEIRAHEPVTFEIVRADPPRPWSCEKWPITWRVDGEIVALTAGPRLTYVYSGPSSKTRVTATIGDELGEARGEIPVGKAAPQDSRLRSWLMSVLATALGVAVASAAAVALAWTEKPFGSWADYMALLTTGLGVDVGLGGGRKLLASAVERLRHGTERSGHAS